MDGMGWDGMGWDGILTTYELKLGKKEIREKYVAKEKTQKKKRTASDSGGKATAAADASSLLA